MSDVTDSAVLVQWGIPYPGREPISMGVFMSAVKLYSDLEEAGKIANMNVYLNREGCFARHTGTMVVEGTAAQIDALLASEDHQRLMTQGSHVATNFTVQRADTGPAVLRRVDQMNAVRDELGIAEPPTSSS